MYIEFLFRTFNSVSLRLVGGCCTQRVTKDIRKSRGRAPSSKKRKSKNDRNASVRQVRHSSTSNPSRTTADTRPDKTRKASVPHPRDSWHSNRSNKLRVRKWRIVVFVLTEPGKPLLPRPRDPLEATLMMGAKRSQVQLPNFCVTQRGLRIGSNSPSTQLSKSALTQNQLWNSPLVQMPNSARHRPRISS